MDGPPLITVLRFEGSWCIGVNGEPSWRGEVIRPPLQIMLALIILREGKGLSQGGAEGHPVWRLATFYLQSFHSEKHRHPCPARASVLSIFASRRMPTQPLDRIESNPDVLSGQPVVRGTRLPVYVIVDAIAEGDSVEDLLEAYPFLERADVQQALHFAARMSRVEEAVA